MANPKPELSKQEILESIGRIVSEGEGRDSGTQEVAPPEAAPTPAAGEDDDILDLVDMVDEQGNVIHLDRVREAAKDVPAGDAQALETLRPMLQAWLDTHMPPMVERLVKRELERASDRSEPE